MGLMSFLSKQFIDVIEMPELEEDLLVKKFYMKDQEIQYGGTLVVRESQMAIFVNEGKLADVFGPGTYKLTTKNIPLLTNLKNWDKAFQSPFKSDVYFLNTKLQINAGWGTSQPITISDKEFGLVRLRAFGKYTYKITDPKNFFTNISGAVDYYERQTLENQLRNIIISHFSNFLANSNVPFINMAANQLDLGKNIKQSLESEFVNYGLKLEQFIVENLNLPDDLQKVLDQRISVGIMGENLDKFTKYQSAQAITMAAQNEGGVAGIGAGLGVGAIMAQNMAESIKNTETNTQTSSLEDRLSKAKTMLDKGLINQKEYDKVKSEILAKLSE